MYPEAPVTRQRDGKDISQVSHGFGGRRRIDFAIPDRKIGIELDGHATHSSTQAIADDRRRQRRLESAGWRIIRFGGAEVYADANGCVRQAAALAGMPTAS
jgi:very-short-patch-repair endonuclease